MTAVQLLDAARLLTFLDTHATHGHPIRKAIYEGTATRIRRGDFNTREDTP